MKILICDDAGFIRQILMDVIATHGQHTIWEARNGKEAVDIATQVCPDVCFMDVVLPEQNGIEAARAIREQCPQTKIFALSTLSQEDIETIKPLDTTFDHFIVKPFTPNQIIDLLNKGESL
ncbi:MAG: response regulator [Bdellovibrionaceae bacterium]|nr:response regulator [Pseudobdellovibrionaceae bacterium]MDW8190444.1 response regulator [Pseudobdellovibrionaceae bacterium]